MNPPPSPPTDVDAAASAGDGFYEQALFRSLHEAYPDGLLVVDAAGHIVLTNQAAERLLGYRRDELVGMAVDQLVPDAIRARHAAYRHAYADQPRPRPMGTQMDLVARRKDGSEVMVEIALSPLQAQGLPLVVAAIRDIGSYPRVRQALRRARYADQLAQLSRDAVEVRDVQALVVRVPPALLQALEAGAAALLLNSDPGQAEGPSLRLAAQAGAPLPMATDTADAHAAARHTLTEGLPLASAELAAETRFAVPPAWLAAGQRSLLAVPLIDRGRPAGVLQVLAPQPARFGDDERRFLESLANLLLSCLQRARSEEALHHAQRLESVGQLTGGIAHDFNNLLMVIQGNLQVLQESPSHADATAQGLLGPALRATRRGAELTRQLLAFSRRQVLEPTDVDVNGLLQSLAGMLQRTLDQRIRIEVASTGTPRVRADAGQLESALLNIAINARDAMPDGGLLRFETTVLAALPDALRATLDRDASADVPFVAIAVSDTGGGMTDAVKERAFEPFFTTKGAGRGTGLGLSTVYGFTRQSRGTVALRSAPGQGSTVTLYIPAAVAEATSDPDSAAPAQLPAGLSVLVVEDDAEVRRVVAAFLAALGCRATLCSSAEEALPLLQPGAAFEALLSDISLGPGQRGTELAAEAQQRLPAMAILLMSGYPEELLAVDESAPPSWELLRKPFDREALGAALARALASCDA